ncbi:MAG: hypothetical protein ACXU7H_00165 [Burkholderiaceae bacterium]
MIDNTPPAIPKESGSWKGTVLSIAVHALIFGAIWVAMRHESGKQPVRTDSQSAAQNQVGDTVVPIATAATTPEIKSAVKDNQPVITAADTIPIPVKSDPVPSVAAVKPVAPQAILSDPEPKHIVKKVSVVSSENKKSIEEKKQKHKSDVAMANKRAKLKSEALAEKGKQKKKAEEAELLAKKHAGELAVKVAAESQKRKELEDQRAMEKMHQEEMQRIKSSLSGNG